MYIKLKEKYTYAAMKIVVGVTGASGIVLADRLLSALKDHETFLVISEGAKKVGAFEGYASMNALQDAASHVYDDADFGAPIASSSFPVDAMAIVPTSMKTLSAVAAGYADTLITRSAENMLKFGKPLVVCPRETPLSLSALKNMAALKRAGALVCPPVLAFYPHPGSVDDVVDFAAGKVLDCLGVDHDLYMRWGTR